MKSIKHVGPFENCDLLTSDAEQWLKRKYDYTCLRCLKREPEIKLVIDHIVPKSRFGAHTVGNAQPLCTRCNAWKGVKAIDYRALDSVLVQELPLLETAIGDHHITYQFQTRKCGKSSCSTCNGDQAPGHGPYWYAYWRENGRLLSCYVGREKPEKAGSLGIRNYHHTIAIQARLF